MPNNRTVISRLSFFNPLSETGSFSNDGPEKMKTVIQNIADCGWALEQPDLGAVFKNTWDILIGSHYSEQKKKGLLDFLVLPILPVFLKESFVFITGSSDNISSKYKDIFTPAFAITVAAVLAPIILALEIARLALAIAAFIPTSYIYLVVGILHPLASLTIDLSKWAMDQLSGLFTSTERQDEPTSTTSDIVTESSGLSSPMIRA